MVYRALTFTFLPLLMLFGSTGLEEMTASDTPWDPNSTVTVVSTTL
ncbi:hypothetical protein [Lentzea tibetensis]|nr:hypothetical protein [Lentzea tibetensis]